ncbi:FxsA family protein [Nonomuraea sp. NBC_01738]|uniref:FxsA family protein n=1 Tax=Nonomuraea sp. NBC_01738 TaxID=2976003 RepID=UPI002E0F807A|nr:FxsA family protein [Nonomuraea sp. NBC_01738]
MVRLSLFLAFLVVPVLEIWLAFQVGAAIGGPATVALLAAGVVVGGWVVRREGRRAWRELNAALQAGRMPERELADSGFVLAGGALLMVPGFLTDVLGLLFLVPFTRPLLRRLGSWFFAKRIKAMAGASPYANLGTPFQERAEQAPYKDVVHGEVIREERDGGDVIQGEIVRKNRD